MVSAELAPVAFRIERRITCTGEHLYVVCLLYADGAEATVGRLCRTERGARNQKGIALPAQEVR